MSGKRSKRLMGVVVGLAVAAIAAGSSIIAATAVAASPTATTASGTVKQKVEGKTIAIVDCCRSADAALRAEQGITAGAESVGWKVLAVDGAGVPTNWETDMMNYVNQHVNAIFLVAIDPSAVEPAMAAAKAANIPVFGAQVAPRAQYTDYAVTNQLAGGEAQGEYIVHRLGPKGGDIAELNYCVGVEQLQCQGFADVLKKNPQVHVVAKAYEDPADLLGNGRTTMSEILQAHSNLKAVWTCCDPVAVGAAEAIKAAGKSKQVFVVGLSGDADAVDLIRSGSPLAMTEGASMTSVGWTALGEALKYFSGGKLGKPALVPFTQLTLANVGKYVKPGKSFDGTYNYVAAFKALWKKLYGV